MTDEQRLVSQIREFLRAVRQEKDPAIEDLAEQYTEVCRRANERLTKCGDFLDKGMRSEAVQEAQVQPALLPLVETINFQDVTRWRTVCTDLGMAVFPPLRLEIVERLRSECTKEEFLSPLLREYRRLVHQGHKEECIDILRRIRELDKDNPVWSENLVPLEQDRTQRLVDQARDALRDHDVEKLRELYDELSDPRRVTEAPKPILDRLSEVLRRQREEAATQEGLRLVQGIAAAADSQDFENLGMLLEKWTRLACYDDYHPDQDLAATVAKAQHWHETEARRRQEERGFANALDAVRHELDRTEVDPAALGAAWRGLEGFGRSLPEGLRTAVDGVYGRLRRQESRRRAARAVRNTVLALVVLVVLAAGAAFALWHVQQKRQTAELRALVERGDYAGAKAYLDGLSRQWPMLGASPAVRQYRAGIEETLAEQAHQDAEFGVVMDQLSDIREKGFELPEAQIRGLLAKAEQLAQSGTAQTRLKAWHLAWDMWTAKRQRDADDEYGRLVVAVQQGIDGRKRLPPNNLDAEGKALEALQAHLRAATEAATRVTPALGEQLPPLAAAIQEWAKDFETRRGAREDAQTRRLRTLRAMDAALPEIDAYADVLRGFVEQFADAPERAQIQRALDEAGLFQDAVALQAFRPTAIPPPANQLDDARQLLQALVAGEASIWRPDLQACVDAADKADELRRRVADLGKAPWVSLSVLYTRPLGGSDDAWEPVYYPGEIVSRDDKLPDGQPYTLYWGRAYTPSDTDATPLLEHRKWSTAECDVRIQKRRESNLVPEARFVRDLLAALPQAADATAFALAAIDRLAKLPDIDPIAKGEIVRHLAAAVRDTATGTVPELDRLVADLPEPNPQINWINSRHPDVVEARERAAKVLVDLPSTQGIGNAVRLNRALLAQALGRRVRCVGSVKQDASGRRLLPVLRNPALAFVWVITPDRGAQRRQFVEVPLTRAETGEPDVPQEFRRLLYLGQVLFAPTDAQPTGQWLGANLPADNLPPLTWPASWPANARDAVR